MAIVVSPTTPYLYASFFLLSFLRKPLPLCRIQVRILLLLSPRTTCPVRKFREPRCYNGRRIRWLCRHVSTSGFQRKIPPSTAQIPGIDWIFRQSKKVYKIRNLTDEEATLVEPASCAIHGLDKLNPPVGIEALIFGAGPTGWHLIKFNFEYSSNLRFPRPHFGPTLEAKWRFKGCYCCQ